MDSSEVWIHIALSWRMMYPQPTLREQVEAALNMVRTVQQNLGSYVSIGLLRDRIGRQPWILAPSLP